MVVVLEIVNGKREMLVFSVLVCLSSIFTLCLGTPRYYHEPYYRDSYYSNDEGDNLVYDLLFSRERAEDDGENPTLPELPANGELFEGDIVMDERLRRAVLGEQTKKSAISGLEERKLMWPDGILYYEIDEGFGPQHRAMLRKAMDEFENRTCIRFIKHTNETNYIFYTQNEDECSSNIGMSGGRQNITLGIHCGVLGTFEHETMHALGFIHEHSRPDRDDYIHVNFSNIKKKEWVNFQKYKMDQITNLKEEFNFASIMLYRNDAFTKNGEDTLKAVTEPDLKFGQRVKFSAGDIKEINQLYNCKYYINHPNYHHLYKEYHTKKRKRKKDIRKDILLRRRMLEFLFNMKRKLAAGELNYID